MPKIAMIGAGSVIFAKTLASDILATPGLTDIEFRLMSRTWPKLERMQKFLQRMIDDNGLKATVTATLDRREAVKNADYVINMIDVGGVEGFGYDYEIPLKYGVDQCIADSLGPGGVMRGLRTFPILEDMVKDVEELAAPGALFFNYTNPMGAVCHAIGVFSDVIPYIGLCHGVQTTLDLISSYTNVPKNQIDYLCAGINHMDWFLKLEDKRDGRDLKPILRERFEDPAYYIHEKVRGEVMRHFGYFMTESTGHLSEYIPWFRSSKRALDRYCDQPDFGGATGAYYKYTRMLAEKYSNVDYLEMEISDVDKRSAEYCSWIIEAKELDKPFRLQGNVRNNGFIDNLPQGCCVEIPVYIDHQGIRPLRVGSLPPQCAAMNLSNITVQSLAVEAHVRQDPEHVMHAIAMDPLTSAVCTLEEIRRMTAEMLEANRKWLPQFEGKTLRATPHISIPEDLKPVEVPLDPALAVANRFGELASRETE